MALKWLRDNLKHLKFILWGVVLVFIGLVFNEWGRGGAQGSGGGGDYVVRVGNQDLSQREFYRKLQERNSMYQRRFGEQWEKFKTQINLPKQIVDEFVTSELLAQEARRLGLVVSDDEVNDRIKLMFSPEGQFVGKERYEGYVRRNMGITPREFEEQVRQELLVEKLRGVLTRGLYVSDKEAEEEYRRGKEAASFSVIQVPLSAYLSEVDADEAEIAQYHSEHAEELRRDEQRVIRYLMVETSRLRRLLEVDDSEIEQYYETNGDEFLEGEKAHASHVLISVDPGASESERADAQLRAESIAKMARQGADFAELAKKHSGDPGSKEKGGDLGWFGRGQMVKEFEEAVFNNKPGDIIGPIKSEHGYHVIKIEGFKAASQQPLDQVREQIRRRLVEGRAASEAEVRAGALEARLRANPPADDDAWQAIADEDEAVVLNISPPFGEGDMIQGIGNDPELVEQAFKTAAGEIVGKRAVSRGWIVWQLKQINPAGIPPLEEVEAQVRQLVLRNKARELAKEKAAELANQWRAGGNAEELAKSVSAQVNEATDFRRGSSITGIGTAPALERAVFAGQVDDVVGPVAVADRGVAIAHITSLELVTAEEVAEQLESSRQLLVEQRSNELLSSILGELHRQTEVRQNRAFLDKFLEESQAQPVG